MHPRRILIIDDERNFREFLGEALATEGYSVRLAATARAGLDLARQESPDYILLDQNLPDGDGLELLPRLTRLPGTPVVIVITAYAGFPKAVEAIKSGAFHYLAKPFEFGDLLRTLATARPRETTPEPQPEPDVLSAIVGESLVLASLKEQIRRVARSPVSTVLIRGESGTGKELFARAIHELSARAGRRLVSVNCAALTETLLLNELFGHERGAYTDARETKQGLFETAHGGTLFLDEIGEMTPRSQAALLRAVEQRTITRVGGTREIPVDVRVVAATNRPLQHRVAEGQFRADLYYRLSVIEILIPPLRERGDDVLRLADHFSAAMAARYGGPPRPLAPETAALFRRYPWPGNVRELRNVIERAYVIGAGPVITPDDVPEEIRLGRGPVDAWPLACPGTPFRDAKRRAIARFEESYLREALRRAGGNITRAAEDAGMLRQAFQRLLKHHGIDAREFRRTGPRA
ncbi:MAG TPA: sigma-54 dependent transcriptional regulator [Longimicrobiales bacterium]